MCFPAKKEVQSAYQERHEKKLRIVPEDFAMTLEDFAEREDLMYDFHTFEKADWGLRSWGLHLLGETEALEKIEQRKREKQQSLFSEVTGRRGMLWVSSAHDSPNWPLDETYDEDGVSKHDMHEQWTPLLDGHVNYDAIQYLYERYPEVCEQLESAESPAELFMEEHLVPNTSEWMVARMVMELHLNKARREMREIEAVEQHIAKATNGMAEMDWAHRNVDRFAFGQMAQTQRLAIILTQKEHCADWRLIEALEK